MPDIQYLSPATIESSLQQISDRFERVQTFADIARFNTLYMIMRAGSGHIGSSFSAMDIVSWLYAEEMTR